MTVQELIDELSKVEDKTMEVYFPYSLIQNLKKK